MASPSAQLIDDPPSSPFVSEISAQSRMASKQWDVPMNEDHGNEQSQEVFMTPYKPTFDAIEDKENLPQSDEYISPSNREEFPRSPTFPAQKPARLTNDVHVEEQINNDHDLNEMVPLPSTRRTPRSSPRKFAQKVASTPSTAHRESSTQNLNTFHEEISSTPRSTRELRTPPQEHTSVDDTCFSTFSEIPDMTLFAKLGQSTTRRGDALQTPGSRIEATPRTSRKRSSPSRSPSPTPRRMKTPSHAANNNPNHNDGTTSFLIDFTQQMENLSSYRSASPNKPSSSSSSSSHPNLLNYLNSQRSPAKSARQSFATPAKTSSIMNLLDFELPPAPTPRSIPTITVRELESLKSSYLSQISSLKATLSGREAEVESLKRAIGDAERRAGEAQEGLREEKCRRENIEEEKAQWERRGQEVENVLKNVKEEVMKGEVEKEDLLRRIEESERRGEEAEERAGRAEERYAAALAARASESGGRGPDAEEQVQQLVAAQIDAKIEAVSRELHAVYKEKHERKVATLKKSYEARGEKKCAELQARVTELEKQNDDLQAAKDATFSGPVPDTSMVVVAGEAELKAQLEEQKAHLARLENEMQTSRQQQEQLMRELQQERIEKGDLVAAVDEMLALQSEPGPAQNAAASVVEDFRKSISRPTSLRPPSGVGESKIGRGVPSVLNKSISAPGKSKMLANIERMGRAASGNGSE